MNRPILLADVDGVFNPFPFDPARSADWKFEPTFASSQESGGFELNLSKEMGAAVLALGCEIHWLTTWMYDEDFANPEIGKALGWGPKAVALGGDCPDGAAFLRVSWKAKLMAAMMHRHPDRKFVWIDDDAVRMVEKCEAAGINPDPILRPDQGPRLLVVAPESGVGLTKAQLAQVQKFLEE